MQKPSITSNPYSFRIVTPASKQEFSDYYHLRWQLLRAPWQQPLGSEQDEHEQQAFHRMLVDEHNHVIAVGRLHMVEEHNAQIRYMAVISEYQGKGIGKMLLNELENIALQQNIKKIVLDARAPAVGFYEHHNYRVVNKAHQLFGVIQHYRMEKQLAAQP